MTAPQRNSHVQLHQSWGRRGTELQKVITNLTLHFPQLTVYLHSNCLKFPLTCIDYRYKLTLASISISVYLLVWYLVAAPVPVEDDRTTEKQSCAAPATTPVKKTRRGGAKNAPQRKRQRMRSALLLALKKKFAADKGNAKESFDYTIYVYMNPFLQSVFVRVVWYLLQFYWMSKPERRGWSLHYLCWMSKPERREWSLCYYLC